jgi:hypothetical protein
VVRASSRRVRLWVVVLVMLGAPLSAWSAVTSAGVGPGLRPAAASTGTVLTVRLPSGACAQARLSAVVTVTDRQRRPLARVRVTLRGGSRISPAIGVTAATGKVTLRILPVPFRRGPVVLTVTATPTDRLAVTKQLTLPGC